MALRSGVCGERGSRHLVIAFVVMGSANQDGDAIGGSVNLVTKTAQDSPYSTVSAMGGYTGIVGGRGLDQIAATAATRFGGDKRMGVLFGASYDWNGRGINDIEPSPGTVDLGHGPVPVQTAMDIREYLYRRARVGAAGGLDYRLGGGSSAFVRGLFSVQSPNPGGAGRVTAHK